ncbi:MAG: cupin domain-containing protein [Candidatus Bathyarchaeota archaeon]|nr:cupin domain-containing protein [Candidatus Bathyarchaeota archaeon]
MKIVKVHDAESVQNAHGVDARKIYASPNAEVIHMALQRDEALKRHTTPVNVFFYILEGKGVVEVGDQATEVEKDTIIDSPKGIPHLLRNTGEDVFRFLVVKLPKTA